MNNHIVKLLPAVIVSIIAGAYAPHVFAAGGTTGAQVLSIVPDARSAALGKTFVGVADNINSLFYNPAGLAQITNMEVPMAKNYVMDDVDQQYAGFATNLRNVRTTNVKSMGTLAANYMTLETGNIVSRNDAGVAGPNFKAKDELITIGYGKLFYESSTAGSFMGGVSMKMYKEEIQNEDSQGQAFDVGTLWKAPGERMYIGLALQNAGPQNKFLTEKYDLPSVVALGFSGGMFDNACIIAVDFKKPIHDSLTYSTGVEYWFNHTIALRLGYDSSTVDAGNGLSAGFGVCLLQTDVFFVYASEIDLDYAFVPYGDLGDSHRLSLLFKIGAD
jgi:hypothetical protein